MPQPTPFHLGPYECLASIGRGGMGEVFRGRDTRLGRDVAIKILLPEVAQDPDRLRRFEQEARAVAAITHPNLLQVYDIGTHQDVPYLVLELLEGQTLRARFPQRPLPPRVAVQVGIQIARGLAAAHAKGVIHRDLKPENIFITREEQVKLLDFGLAKLREGTPDETATLAGEGELLTRPGLVVGTVGYMSPEQVTGKGVDARSDLFAVGVLLWEMIGGERPFQGNSLVETMHAILKEEPRDFPSRLGVPPALARVIQRCLQKDPAARFQTAQDLAFALEGLDLSSAPRLRLPFLPMLPRLSWRTLALPSALILGGLAFWGGTQFRNTSVPTLRRLSYQRGVVHSARFTPDGQSYILTRGPAGQAPTLWMGRVDGVGAQPLEAPEGSRVQSVSRTGEVAILQPGARDNYGTLCRVGLTGGAPRPVAELVREADWTPDGKELAVLRSGPDGRDRIEFPLGSPVYQIPGTHEVESLRVSPDGSQVAFVEHLDLSRSMICVVNRKGTRKVVLQEKAYQVLWAPSGRTLIYSSRREEDRNEIRATTLSGRSRLLHSAQGVVELMDINREGRVLLAHKLSRTAMALQREGEGEDVDLSWLQTSNIADLSPDGRGVLFLETGEGRGPGGVYFRRLGDREAVRLGDGDPLTLSPDGKWALAKYVGQTTDLQLLPIGPGDIRRVSTQGISADWALFRSPTTLVMGGGPKGAQELHPYLLDLVSGSLSELPHAIPRSAFAAVSPDGQRLAIGPVGSELLVISLDGSPIRRIPGFGTGTQLLQWSNQPDSVFTVDSYTTLPTAIRRFDLRTGTFTLVRLLRPGAMTDIHRLRFVSITPDGKSAGYSFDQTLCSDLYLMEGWK